jgi:hypothetical protein
MDKFYRFALRFIDVDRLVELQYLERVFWPWGSSMELRFAVFTAGTLCT